MNLNTGGPAFPQHGWTKDPEVLERMRNRGGMTLLDWMAGQALVSLSVFTAQQPNATVEDVAGDAYDIAEAMLAEKARREAVVRESSTTDHFPDATKMIPGGFAEDTLRRLATDVLHSDIKDAAEEAPLTWCAEQVRARVNTLGDMNRKLVEALEKVLDCIQETRGPSAFSAVADARAILAKAKEVA